MSETNMTDDLVKQLGQMTVVQVAELTKKLEVAWGVTATPQVLAVVPTNSPAKEEQTEFSVVLTSFPADKKMGLVKLVRELCGLGLLEAKNLVEAAPKALKEDMSKEDAENMKSKLVEAGAVVELK